METVCVKQRSQRSFSSRERIVNKYSRHCDRNLVSSELSYENEVNASY